MLLTIKPAKQYSGTGCDLSGCAGTRPQCIMQHDIKVLSAYDKSLACHMKI